MIRKLTLTAAAALLALALVAPPAAAAVGQPVVVADPRGDGHGPGDVRSLKIGQAGSNFVFQVRTQQPINIHTANAWKLDSSTSELRFNLGMPGGPRIDWAVVVQPHQGMDGGAGVRIQSFLPDRPTARACDINLGQPTATIIRVRVSRSCIGEPTRVRAFARYRLDQGGNGSIDSDDRAPNNGFSGFMDFALPD